MRLARAGGHGGVAMKKREKRVTTRSKRPLKELSAKTASTVKGGAIAKIPGTTKWSDITLK
jgi:hypothetical protein